MIEPLEDRVLVRMDEPAEMTSGGLYLPQQAEQRVAVGTVLAVGPGRWEKGARVRVKVDVGDRVIVHPYAGHALDQDGVEVQLVPGVDVWCVIRPN